MVLAVYLAFESGVMLVLWQTRQWVFEEYSTEAAQTDWNEWVDEAKRQANGDGPIRRRVPKSAQPPALVLMRDYYPTCLAGAWLFTSLLFAKIIYFGQALLFRRSTR